MTRLAILLCAGLLVAAAACSRQPQGDGAARGASPGLSQGASQGSSPRRQASAESTPANAPDPSLSQAAGEAQQAAADALRTRPEAPAEGDRR